MKMSLHKKILTGFIACSVILLIIGAISFQNNRKFTDTNEWVNHTHEVLYELDQILVASLDAETGMRGFVLTGNTLFLDPYNKSKVAILTHVQKATDLTKDNPVQQSNMAALATAEDKVVQHIETCISLQRTDPAKARELISSGEGKKYMDNVRDLVDTAKSVENTLLAQRRQASLEDAHSFNTLFIALLSVITLVLIIVYLIITSNLKARKKAEAETAERNWTLAGNAELVKGMQGNKGLQELTQNIINHLATWLNVQLGAVYIAEEDGTWLKLAGAYSIDKAKRDLPPIRFGEGIAGQAAADNRSILIKNINGHSFMVNSSFGEIVPKNIIAVPFAFEKRVIGVIELGSLKSFTELHSQYLSMITDSIAISVTSSQGRQKTIELLEETQRQSEELEVQQEELRRTNEELHAKTELLEKSELELKAQQEELEQTNEELEEKANLLEEQKEKLEVAKMELETKARELEQNSKYKSEFLANMSHELRTPLNSILILAQLLSENKNKTLGQKDVDYARNIYSSGTDLLNLINEILDLSKVEAGKMELEIADVDIGIMVEKLNSMFKEVANNKGIGFSFTYLKEKLDHRLYTDAQRLEQILRNFLSNAFKFTGKGGSVKLEIDIVPARQLKIQQLSRLNEVVAFSVTDTGIGIPQNKQAIIFQAFQQADGSTKRKFGGTGLGLSISRELAHALGGEIKLHSEEGRGSTFTLFLPLKFDASMAASAHREVKVIEAPPLSVAQFEETSSSQDTHQTTDDDRYSIEENSKKILIVEDDEGFSRILLDFFRERGYKGIIAHNGNTGLSLARYYRPDAIVLDMQLPVLDGSDVLKQMKNDPDLRHIPVQIISGFDRRKEGMELGAFDFIRKPVTHTDLQVSLDRIEEFIQKKLKKLLIVEDNKQQNKAIRELIGNGDVKSFSVYTGKEAHELMLKEKFDCIIIDLGLPDMSGIELLEKIKLSEELNKTPIIVYTGKDISREEAARLEKLANTVVLKTATSKERLLDETTLFLHRVESTLPQEKRQIIRQLHRTDEVLKHKKALIVDDDMRNIYSLTNALEEEGLRCITAENGRAAIKSLQEQPDVDIVLMDIMMPEMDGYEATREIRKNAKFEKLPVIALTAKAMKGDREKCLEAGMSDYISKPVNMEQLLSLMRVWLYK